MARSGEAVDGKHQKENSRQKRTGAWGQARLLACPAKGSALSRVEVPSWWFKVKPKRYTLQGKLT